MATRKAPAQLLFSQHAQHVFASLPGAPFPAESLPEVAFIGRSNVGKSSLLNALLGRKSLARVSGTPGATRGAHFYNLGGEMLLVDLPGYGYAKMSKDLSRDIADHVDAYLTNRGSLKLVCVLTDSRHDMKASDIEMIDRLAALGLPVRVVLTKGDKMPVKAWPGICARAEQVLDGRGGVILVSAHKGDGIEDLQNTVYAAAKPAAGATA